MAHPTPPAADGALTALSDLVAARSALDRRELSLIERARHGGATWTAIAAALRLTSRQAAEQRFLRLSERAAQQAAEDHEPVDRGYGDSIVALRRTAAGLLHRLRADQRWSTRFGRADLVRATVEAALHAPPGALYDLLTQAVHDLDATPPAALPATVGAAWDALRRALREASCH